MSLAASRLSEEVRNNCRIGMLLPQRSSLESLIRQAFPAELSLQSMIKSPEALANYEALIVFQQTLSDSEWADCTNLKFIQLLSVGTDGLPLEALRRRGIRIATIDGLNSTAVAEHTVMLILAALRNLLLADRDVRAGKWQSSSQNPIQLIELAGKTVGIVGLGRIGAKVAQRLQAFNVNLLYTDLYSAHDALPELSIERVSLPELLARADILTLHVPLTTATRNLIDRSEIARMKQGIVIVNTSRGEVINEEALVEGLLTGKVARVALDVFEDEPNVSSSLSSKEQATLTPHRAGSSRENWSLRINLALENIRSFLAGLAVKGEVL